ncbi:putative pentatricopeptide repeat-containing protein, chloroplastic-like [Capsicum annuum]|nr:putative pentatricopeptide repeat-containing protein, chloroplastic-like [Capsicum annuum]
MEFRPSSWRSRKPPPPATTPKQQQQSDDNIYSTFITHNNNLKSSEDEKDNSTLYSTMLYKDNDAETPNGDEDEDDDEESLPPLLKRLPKDFGGGDDDDVASISDTMIVKTDRSSKFPQQTARYMSYWDRDDESSSVRRRYQEDEDEEEEGGGFSTFVVKDNDEFDSGTMVRKSSEGVGMSMSRAVASMQAVGEMGIGRQRNRGVVGEEEGGGTLRAQGSKMSSSSIPDSVTREDPSTKYELLHELGKVLFFYLFICFELL